MRLIVVIVLFMSTLYAKNIGVVLVNNNKMGYDEALKLEMEDIFAKQDYAFVGKNRVEVLIDTDQKIKKIYTRSGAVKLIEFAKSKKYDSIALVEYKKGSKNLSTVVIVVDEKVQDRKSSSTAFSLATKYELAKTVISNVMMLNYELGVLNVKDIY